MYIPQNTCSVLSYPKIKSLQQQPLRGLHFPNIYATVPIMLTAKKKLNIIKKHQINDKDTGSPEVQVAILSRKISELASHLKKNHKDNHSRRGPLQMVANRHSHMKYLKKKDVRRYNKLAKEIGIK